MSVVSRSVEWPPSLAAAQFFGFGLIDVDSLGGPLIELVRLCCLVNLRLTLIRPR